MQNKQTVLVAEGDRALRELLRVHLQDAGYHVTLVSDAIVAGRTLLQSGQAVDALIMDAQLPFMSGIDFVASMIADSSLRFVPTIVLCATEEQARRADLLGVPVLTTPLSAPDLLKTLRALLDRPDAPARRHRLPSMRERLAAVRATTPPVSHGLRIVIADDEPDTVTSLSAILSLEGHSVFATQNALEVLPEVRSNRPAAVILDIDMPKVSGFALAREIHEIYGDASPMLLAISGKWVGQTDKMLAELAGFNHFLQKPCHPDVLLKLLEPLVRVDPQATIPCEPFLTSQT